LIISVPETQNAGLSAQVSGLRSQVQPLSALAAETDLVWSFPIRLAACRSRLHPDTLSKGFTSGTRDL